MADDSLRAFGLVITALAWHLSIEGLSLAETMLRDRALYDSSLEPHEVRLLRDIADVLAARRDVVAREKVRAASADD